jgi:hypothetical protein
LHDRRFGQVPGVGVFKTGIPPAQAGTGFGAKSFKGPGVKTVPKAEEDDLLLPLGIQAQAVVFRKRKGGGDVRRGIQGVHQQYAADNGFQVPPAFDSAGNLHLRLAGNNNKVEGVPQTQVIPKKRAGKVVVDFPVIAAHRRGCIQEQDQVYGTPLLPGNVRFPQKGKTRYEYRQPPFNPHDRSPIHHFRAPPRYFPLNRNFFHR